MGCWVAPVGVASVVWVGTQSYHKSMTDGCTRICLCRAGATGSPGSPGSTGESLGSKLAGCLSEVVVVWIQPAMLNWCFIFLSRSFCVDVYCQVPRELQDKMVRATLCLFVLPRCTEPLAARSGVKKDHYVTSSG